jgi:hypothetical protein
MGFVQRTDSNISFNSGTLTFTISPVSTSYDVWVAGTPYTISTTQTTTFASSTTGLYYIFYNTSGNVGNQLNTFFIWDQQAPTAYVYYNASYPSESMFFDERHGVVMDWATHEYLHRTRGAAIANGFTISGFTTTGSGNLLSDVQYTLADGTFFDEDLQVDIINGGSSVWSQTLSPVTGPVIYKDTSGWRKTTSANAPLYNLTAGTFPYYNSFTGSVGSLALPSNNQFIIMWIAASNMVSTPVIAIMGQSAYANLGAAQAAEWADLNLDDLPIVELRPLYQLIFEVKNTFTNAYKSTLRDVIDIRSFSSIVGVAPGYVGPTGPTGVTGPAGLISATGTFYSDYLYWNNTSNAWLSASTQVHIGSNAGLTNQGSNAIAIGNQAGYLSQASGAIAIGYQSAGPTGYQQLNALAIGVHAGAGTQGTNAVAIGNSAGNNQQGVSAVAIGYESGFQDQQENAIAIGNNAGSISQGTNSIAIGYQAGTTNQHANTVILNASGNPLGSNISNACYVDPIRLNPAPGGTSVYVIEYDTTNKEVMYNNTKTFVIDHPTKENMYLVHACLEGPEAGVYYRGHATILEGSEYVEVLLPEYVSHFACDFTIQVTPVYDGRKKSIYSMTEVADSKFRIYGDPGRVHWVVYGKRSSIVTECQKDLVDVQGSGPYKWIA